MQDIGYESHFSLLNLGSIGLFMTIYFYKIVLFILVVIFTTVFCKYRQKDRKREKAFEYQARFRYSLFWGELIIMLLEAYFEFLVAGWL